jgi:ferritin-like metal-binding protein YciE
MIQLSDPRQFFVFKLGAALTMEETILPMLRELSEAADASRLREQLLRHREETRGQIRNVMQAFEALGYRPKAQPSTAIDGLKTEAELTLQLATPELSDLAILAGVTEIEHYEIGVYESLLTLADELEEGDIRALLKENLEQEESALEDVQKVFEQQAKALAKRVTA